MCVTFYSCLHWYWLNLMDFVLLMSPVPLHCMLFITIKCHDYKINYVNGIGILYVLVDIQLNACMCTQTHAHTYTHTVKLGFLVPWTCVLLDTVHIKLSALPDFWKSKVFFFLSCTFKFCINWLCYHLCLYCLGVHFFPWCQGHASTVEPCFLPALTFWCRNYFFNVSTPCI